ncbi:MAG: Ig-like domain-containing protein [Spirochaetaceae bacterium]
MKKVFCICIMAIISPIYLYSLGQTEESDYKQVSGKENWEYEVPIGEKEPGQYNLLIRAKDKANNETFAGPFDIFIDPESDLPIVSITNPTSFMRVGGVLNIVGTARDDDAIDKVLLKLNDGDYFEASGKEFWSYSFESDILFDGQHTITSKAIDINGLEGHETVVIYNQDTQKPKNSIDNYKNGAIFTNKVTILGTVLDANDIRGLEVSIDDQVTYNKVKLTKDKIEEFYTFEMDIDTRKLPDGANIYWFKSEDKTGSVAFTPFLFFVDNIGPEIFIIDPLDEEMLNGTVTVSGKITDRIGVNSFKYIYGDEIVDINLSQGNPYWSFDINILNEKKKEAKLLFISEDTSGNITELDYSIKIDNELDKPILTLLSPINLEVLKESLLIEGSILDDDKIDGLIVTIDKEESTFIRTFNSFSKTIDGLSSGKHILNISAKDSDGVIGDKQTIEFEIDSYDPILSLNSIKYSENENENVFYPGYTVSTDGNYELLGSIAAGNPITTLKYKIENSEFIDIPFTKLNSTTATFSLPIDSSFHYGVLNFTIVVIDKYGNENSVKSELYVKNYSKVNSEWGISYVSIPTDGDILLTSDTSFNLFFKGPPIKKITMSPKSDIVNISNSGDLITINAKEEGSVDVIKFKVETDKGSFETREFNFYTDNSAPELILNSPEQGSIQSSVIKFQGTINEEFLKSLEYRFSTQSDFTNINWTGSGIEKSFSTTLDIPLTEEESISIEIKATDLSGKKSTITRSILIKENNYIETLTSEEISNNSGKTSDKPKLFINLPLSNGIIFTEPILSGFARDDDKIKEIIITEAVEGGKSFSTDTDGLFDIPLTTFGRGKKVVNVVALDINGIKSNVKKISYTYDPNRPVVKIDSYTESGKTTNYTLGAMISSEIDTIINGSITGDISGNVTYSFNDSEYKKVTLEGSQFSIPLNKELNWGENSLSIKFTDKYNREININSFFYIVDKINTSDIRDDDGIYILDDRIKDDYIDLSSKQILNGLFKGRKIDSIKLEAEKGTVPGFIEVSNSNNIITIKSLKNGISNNIRVVITTIDGDVYNSAYLKFLSDDTNPELSVNVIDNTYIKDKFILDGIIKDDLKVGKLSYSLNRGLTWIDLELIEPIVPVKKEKYTKTNSIDFKKEKKEDAKEFIFHEEIDFINRPDSGYTIWIKATDFNGNEVNQKYSFVKDNTNPELNLFIPGIDEINGIISLIGKTSDNIELESVTYSKDGIEFTKVGNKKIFKFDLDFGIDEVFPETFVIRSTDKSGNYTDIFPVLNINREKDKPTVQIQTPIDGEVIRNDFVISGMAFDDDGVDSIYYALDGGELVPVAQNENNFSINIPLDSVDNNEHIITIKAVDILGVESDIKNSSFWISKKEPTSTLLLPYIDETKRGSIKLVGTSFDENGIDSVYISTDNGVSYQKALGQDEWNYTFNTNNIKDGTYSVFVKAIDNLETVGFYSTLINVDNTPPEIIINEPKDGEILSDEITFSGRSMDNVMLKDVMYKIYSHSLKVKDSIVVSEGKLDTTGIFNIKIPLIGFDSGDYNIELIAYDQADNRSISTRNFSVTESDKAGDIELLFPQSGSTHTSMFNVSGKVSGRKNLDFVELYLDNELFSEIKVDEFMYFNLKIDTLNLEEGQHNIYIKGTVEDGTIYETPEYEFHIQNSGPWVNIINMYTGKNISDRPYLSGDAGYIQPENENILPEDLLPENISPQLVEISLDNGQIFLPADGAAEWSFRIETWQYDDGLTPVLVRCTYSNGETKTSKIVVNIDRSKPEISVLEDLDQGKFNESIKISGIASDANGLTDISVILRDGNKSKYEIPSLFQGMFIDVETGFGKLYGVGLGLTFFDDNVKLQFTLGETRVDEEDDEDARITGLYYGGELLANIYTLELGGLLGPDFDPYSMSLGIGACFTNKTLSISGEDTTMWFSSIIGQVEVFKMKFDNPYISSSSIYIEVEATLISSENSGGFYPRIGIGSRFTLF